MKYKKIFYFILKEIFTVDKNIKNECFAPSTRNKHIMYRLILFVCLMPILYILIFSYIDKGLTVFNIFRTILFILFFRLFAKKLIDYMIVIFFYKSSYAITLKEKRKNKLRKLKRLNKWGF